MHLVVVPTPVIREKALEFVELSLTCRNPTNLATPQPSRLESGSTRTSCATSITMKRRIFWDSLLTTTVQAIRSLLSAEETTANNFSVSDDRLQSRGSRTF